MSVLELFVRLGIAFVTLLALTRLMGRKEISQMTFFNFVSAISIGTIGGSLVTNNTLSISNGFLALAGWAVFTIVMGWIDIKSSKVRQVIEGQPRIVIKQGQIMEKEMREVRLDIDALNTMLRQKNVFSIKDVEYAIFETNGKLSVMNKEGQLPATKSDMNRDITKVPAYPMSTELVSDGKVNYANLNKLNMDEDWLQGELQKAGASDVTDVFYAEIQKDGSLFVDLNQDTLH
ncbi:DUF421 domain-containing protein [Radiobacillus kanasensis]|uniref:YetF domain-containing protein n=1 Tax=Radiobacillus kanasensis TaxID=2844358 RepID=UPI001E4449C6|nr:DUF421 domain-containing protein [Radiobacillus kanasensis]UFU00433.1 DUF421 domain-containing protein [Radiobacillus kanasensis]